MFNLILDISFFSALLFFAMSLERCPSPAAYDPKHPDCISVVSRYVVIALAAFPWITFTKLRAAERELQRVGTKFLLSAGVFSGKTYLSEILISAAVSILFLGLFATRRWAYRLVRRGAEVTTSNSGAESSNQV